MDNMAHTCGEIFLFCLQLFLEVVDLIADWLFFCDVFYLESGLVYGRHTKTAVYSILAFAALGTVLFFLETVNSFLAFCEKKERIVPTINSSAHCEENPHAATTVSSTSALCVKKRYIDPTVFSAFTLCVEDIPQACISLAIAVCREDGSSRFQLAKAGSAIALAVVGLVIVVIEFGKWKKDVRDKSAWKKSKCKTGAFVILFVGIALNIMACVLVFIMSHAHIQPDNSLFIREPTTDFEERYDDRYFVNVSVYFFDPSFQSNASSTPAPDALWIKVAPIDFLRNSSRDPNSLTFQYEYQDTPSHLNMALWDDVGGTLALRECYTLNKENASITAVSNCTQSSFPPGASHGLNVRLLFKPPQFVANVFRKTIYGDIMFGVKAVNPTGGCHPLSQFQNTLPIDGRHAHPALHYFRSSVGSPSDSHLLRDSGRPRLYKASELVDVASVWKTGWTKCSASGHLAPQLDTGLDVQC